MAETTGIEWTDATWNPIQGCTKVDGDCRFCYMYRDKARYNQDPTKLIRSAPATFRAPLNRRQFPAGALVFTASWSDWTHPDAADHVRDAWPIVAERPDLTFQILGKRPERYPAILPPTWGPGWSNVWLGTSVGSPKGAHRAERLAEVEAVVRFLSVEPLWAPGVAQAIRGVVESGRIDWLIVGGESGPEARPMHPAWAREVIELAEASGVPVLFKQWGEWAPAEAGAAAPPAVMLDADGRRFASRSEVAQRARTEGPIRAPYPIHRPGKVAAGREIDGRTLDGYPTPRKGVAPCL